MIWPYYLILYLPKDNDTFTLQTMSLFHLDFLVKQRHLLAVFVFLGAVVHFFQNKFENVSPFALVFLPLLFFVFASILFFYFSPLKYDSFATTTTTTTMADTTTTTIDTTLPSLLPLPPWSTTATFPNNIVVVTWPLSLLLSHKSTHKLILIR